MCVCVCVCCFTHFVKSFRIHVDSVLAPNTLKFNSRACEKCSLCYVDITSNSAVSSRTTFRKRIKWFKFTRQCIRVNELAKFDWKKWSEQGEWIFPFHPRMWCLHACMHACVRTRMMRERSVPHICMRWNVSMCVHSLFYTFHDRKG